MGSIYHWLVNVAGLWKALCGAVCGAAIGYGFAHVVGLPRAFKRHLETQNTIADRLDPDTPGGLGELDLPRKEESS